MESIIYTPIRKKTKWSGRVKTLNDKSYSLIFNINFILEMIIGSTLQFNKLTSANEIYESFMAIHNETDPDIKMELDIDTIDNICRALCANDGVLIKLEKNDQSYYKLNNKYYS